MFTSLFSYVVEHLLFFALHIEGNTVFPKPLSPTKEREMFELKATGDKTARSKLIEHNLRLVAHITKKYYSSSNDHEDLISIGSIGLIKAVDSFDYAKGAKFATYASRCIENEILMHFRWVRKNSCEVFFGEGNDGENECNSLSDSTDEQSIVEDIDNKIKIELLQKQISKILDERELEIIKMRYGVFGSPRFSQREIADKMGISRSYVSRLETKALGKLRDEFDK